MSTMMIPTYRRMLVLLSLGLALTAPSGADANTVTSPFAGRWRGRWMDVTGAQWGSLDIAVGGDGVMSGVITNATLSGSWSGSLGDDGLVSASYQYPVPEFLYSAAAQGRWAANEAGQLVGRLEFRHRGEKIGEGDFTLTRVTAAQDASAGSQVPLCAIYPSLCGAFAGPQPVGPVGLPGYPGAQPVYPPNLTTWLPVVRHNLQALPPAVQEAVFSPALAEAVRSGAVDRRIGDVLGGSVVPLLNFINGTGPGGAAYTNQAAWQVLTGDSPLWQLGAALSPYALPLDQLAACRAAGACR